MNKVEQQREMCRASRQAIKKMLVQGKVEEAERIYQKIVWKTVEEKRRNLYLIWNLISKVKLPENARHWLEGTLDNQIRDGRKGLISLAEVAARYISDEGSNGLVRVGRLNPDIFEQICKAFCNSKVDERIRQYRALEAAVRVTSAKDDEQARIEGWWKELGQHMKWNEIDMTELMGAAIKAENRPAMKWLREINRNGDGKAIVGADRLIAGDADFAVTLRGLGRIVGPVTASQLAMAMEDIPETEVGWAYVTAILPAGSGAQTAREARALLARQKLDREIGPGTEAAKAGTGRENQIARL